MPLLNWTPNKKKRPVRQHQAFRLRERESLLKNNYTTPPPNVETPGPRNPFGPREVLDIANTLLARQPALQCRLSRASRFRRWSH